MNRKRLAMGVAVLVVVGISVDWYFNFRKPPVDPKIQKLRETQQKLVDLPDGNEARTQRRELFGQMTEQMGQLSPEQRKEAFSGGPPPAFIKAMQKRIGPYFELPADQRTAFLDREIKRMEEMMRDLRPMMTAVAVAGGGSGTGGSGPPSGDRMSPERRDQFMRRMLDSTTPAQRAQLSQFFQDLQNRRKELGLPTFPGPSL